jgi:hypothetical protein
MEEFGLQPFDNFLELMPVTFFICFLVVLLQLSQMAASCSQPHSTFRIAVTNYMNISMIIVHLSSLKV